MKGFRQAKKQFHRQPRIHPPASVNPSRGHLTLRTRPSLPPSFSSLHSTVPASEDPFHRQMCRWIRGCKPLI